MAGGLGGTSCAERSSSSGPCAVLIRGGSLDCAGRTRRISDGGGRTTDSADRNAHLRADWLSRLPGRPCAVAREGVTEVTPWQLKGDKRHHQRVGTGWRPDCVSVLRCLGIFAPQHSKQMPLGRRHEHRLEVVVTHHLSGLVDWHMRPDR